MGGIGSAHCQSFWRGSWWRMQQQKALLRIINMNVYMYVHTPNIHTCKHTHTLIRHLISN